MHPNQITRWKTQLLEQAGVVFEGGAQKEPPAVGVKVLHAIIGELTLENVYFRVRSPWPAC